MRAWIQRACHSASWEPLDPIVSMSVAEAEHLSNRADIELPVRLGCLAAQFGNGAMRDLVDDALGQHLERLLLLGRQLSKLAVHASHFGGPQMLELLLKAHDGRDHLARL